MSHENVEIVRSVAMPMDGIDVAAIDWDAAAIRELLGQAYAPDIELTTLAGVASDLDELYRGLDDLVRYLRGWLEPFSEYHVEALDFVEAGDCVLVPSRQWGIGRGSGARVEIELTTLFEVQHGQITRLHLFASLEEAVEAAGLRE